MNPKGPLDGLQVLDLSSFTIGAFLSLQLSDLGADVVKVESPSGDPYRHFAPKWQQVSIGFAAINRDKRSVVLDLTGREDFTALLDLISKSDVLISNWRPGVAERLGLDESRLRRQNPRIVDVWITGFGPEGPRSRQTVFDPLVQALSGLAVAEGTGSSPRILRSYVADKATSLLAAQSVLAALLARERTGVGCRIELSMLDSLAYFDFADATSTSALVDHPEIEGYGAPTAMLATSDGHVVIAPNRRREVRNVCIAAGHPEWSEQLIVLEDFREIVGRLGDLLEPIGALATTFEWMERFSEHGVPAAPVLDEIGHLEDPQVRHNNTYGEFDDPRIGRVRFARHPARFVLPDGPTALDDTSAHHGFPDLGQHTRDLVTGRGDNPGGPQQEESAGEQRPYGTAEEEGR